MGSVSREEAREAVRRVSGRIGRLYMEDRLRCCELTCENIAAFEIWNQRESIDPYDYTHACQEHVGEMLYEDSRVFLLPQAAVATPTK
jgi:hypothetical protein